VGKPTFSARPAAMLNGKMLLGRPVTVEQYLGLEEREEGDGDDDDDDEEDRDAGLPVGPGRFDMLENYQNKILIIGNTRTGIRPRGFGLAPTLLTVKCQMLEILPLSPWT